MANPKILLKRSSVTGSVPSTLDSGELALNTTDGKIFFKATDGTIKSFLDSAGVETLISNSIATIDSAEVIQLIDSDYIQARQITYIIPTIDNDFVDSARVLQIISDAHIKSVVDSAYVASIVSTDGDINITINNEITSTVDSAYVQARVDANDFLDSAEALALIDSAHVRGKIDTAYINSLNVNSTTLDANDGSYYLDYNNFTNTPTILDNVDIENQVDSDYVQARQITYDTSDFTDSAYVKARVDSAVNALIDGAPGALDTLNEIAEALNDDSDAYNTLLGRINALFDSAELTDFIDSAYIRARQIKYLDSDAVKAITLDSSEIATVVTQAYVRARQDFDYNSLNNIPTSLSDFANDLFTSTDDLGEGSTNLYYTTARTESDASALVDSAYVQARQITYDFLDSSEAIALIDSAYIQLRQSAGTDATQDMIDSSITAQVDSAYVQARQIKYSNADFLDSNTITGVVDSDYVQLRQTPQDFAYSSLTGTPTIPAFGTDFVDSAYVDGVLPKFGTDYVDSAFVTGQGYITSSSLPVLGTDFIDSAEALKLIDANALDSNRAISLIDSAYVQARQITYSNADFLDSSTIEGVVDSAYVQLRQTAQDFAYSSLTGAPTTVSSFTNDANYLDSTTVLPLIPKFGTDYVDSSTVIDIINSEGLDSDLVIALVDSAYIQLRDRFQDSSLVTSTVNQTYIRDRETPNPVLGTDFVDSAEALKLIDANALDSARADTLISSKLGAANEIVIVDSAGGSVLASTATLSIDPSSNFVGINQTSPEVTLHMTGEGPQTAQIRMEQYNNTSDAPDLRTRRYRGTEANPLNIQAGDYLYRMNIEAYDDSAISTYASMEFDADTTNVNGMHFTLRTRDRAGNIDDRIEIIDGAVKFNSAYTFPTSDGTSGQFLKTDGEGNLSYDSAASPLALGIDFIDSAEALKLIDANALDSGRATSLIDSAYVNLRADHYTGFDSDFTAKSTDDLSEGSTNLYYTKERADSDIAASLDDSGNTVNITINNTIEDKVDSAYVLARVNEAPFLDSADAIQLIDSAYIQARQVDLQRDSAFVTGIVDSDYVRLQTRIGDSDIDFGSHKILYSNVYSAEGDLPSASTYHGMFAHVHGTGAGYFAHAGSWIRLANQSEIFDGAYSSLTGTPTIPSLGNDFVDSGQVQIIIDSAYVQARQTAGTDSAATIALIEATVDSAYVQLRQAAGGGGEGTVDSAQTIALIEATVDSNYVLSRVDSDYEKPINQVVYIYTADSGQTAFTDSDDNGLDLSFTSEQQLTIFLNGILLSGTSDVSTNSSTNTVTLTEAADSGDVLSIIKLSGAKPHIDSDMINNISLKQVTYVYTADSGQTAFTGADDNSNILSLADNARVSLNGILLLQTVDFTRTGDTVTLITAADSGDILTVEKFQGRDAALDSALINNVAMSFTQYVYTADSGDTTFSGADDNGLTLAYTANRVRVHINGILQVDSADYTATNGTSVVLTEAADSGDVIQIEKFAGRDVGLDSGDITLLIDSAYIQARQTDIFRDSGFVTTIIDSAYINARTEAGTDSAATIALINANALDSAEAITLIDSAYVRQRVKTDQDLLTTSDVTFNTVTADLNGAIEFTAKNAEGSTLTKGTVVYISGVSGNNPTVAKADASDPAKMPAFGIVSEDANNNANTIVFTFGTLYNLDTSAFNAGDTLYVSATAGELTNVKPAGESNLLQNIGRVIRSHGSAGSIKVGGAGRTNATPNLDNNQFFLGNDSNYAVAVDFTTTVEGVVDSAYVQLRQDYAYGSLTGTPTIPALGTDFIDSAEAIKLITANAIDSGVALQLLLDSIETIALIDSDYIRARTRIGDSDIDFGSNKILYSNVYSAEGDLPSASTYHGMFAHVHGTGAGYFAHAGNWVRLANQSEIFDGAYGSLTGTPTIPALGTDFVDSAQVELIIDSAYVAARSASGGTDSAATIALIEATVDSAYVALREANSGGGSGLDSSAIIALIDSDYVAAREADAGVSGGGGTDSSEVRSIIADELGSTSNTIKRNVFTYEADSGDTVFTGADDNGTTLSVEPDNSLVFVNGILMIETVDYTLTSTTLTMTEEIDSGYNVTIVENVGKAETLLYTEAKFEYTLDSGDTYVSGNDDDGISLILNTTTDNIDVFLNGVLLSETADYSIDSNSVTLVNDADSADLLTITTRRGQVVTPTINTFEYTADSGQTAFSGADDNSSTLAYSSGAIQVHVNGILLRETDYTATNGSSVTLTEAADSGDDILISAFSASKNTKWTERTSSVSVESNTKNIIDCSGGSITVTFPASPVFGDEIRIIDGTGNAASNNIVINRNGNKIQGASDNFTIDVNRAAVGFVYYNAAQGWILIEN